MNNYLVRLTMRKREKTLLNKIRNEREDISTNPEDIRRFLRGSRRKNNARLYRLVFHLGF